jgi:hypothetical protein
VLAESLDDFQKAVTPNKTCAIWVDVKHCTQDTQEIEARDCLAVSESICNTTEEL